MKYSFVLPAYKANFLKIAIDSILSQTYTDFELIIVNDASPQNLDSIVGKYKDERIRYYTNEKNIGGDDLVKQWNKCILYAKGDYLILASDDDVYHHRYLEKMNVLVNKYPDINVFRPRIQIIDRYGNPTKTEAFTREKTSLHEFMYLHGKHIMSGVPYYILKRQSLLEMGGFINFPMAWGSDDATVMTLMKENGMITTEEILFSFRMSEENITSKRNNSQSLSKKIKARFDFYEWRKKILRSSPPKNELDSLYLKWIEQNKFQQLKQGLYELMCDSTLFACFSCIRQIINNPVCNLKWIISCYVKRVFQTLFY